MVGPKAPSRPPGCCPPRANVHSQPQGAMWQLGEMSRSLPSTSTRLRSQFLIILVVSNQNENGCVIATRDYRTEYMRRRYRLFWTSEGR